MLLHNSVTSYPNSSVVYVYVCMRACLYVCVKHFDTLLFDLSDVGEAMLPMHDEQLHGEQYIASCNKRKVSIGNL